MYHTAPTTTTYVIVTSTPYVWPTPYVRPGTNAVTGTNTGAGTNTGTAADAGIALPETQENLKMDVPLTGPEETTNAAAARPTSA